MSMFIAASAGPVVLGSTLGRSIVIEFFSVLLLASSYKA